MTIKLIKDKTTPIEVDLTGPDGNAFAVIGMCRDWAKQLEWSREEIKEMQDDMTSGDYEHLISVAEKHFGQYVTFYK